ncbi:MAG: hypothetical protein AB1457_00595 [Chloroflexota bacterium]|nr:MAG: hypothetical protein KatS3mg047_0461 [Bellilinea sp.]
MNGSIYHKCELIFWDIAIDLLTRSGWLRNLIRQAILLKSSPNFKLYCSIVIFSGLFGFFVGFSIPHFLQFLW